MISDEKLDRKIRWLLKFLEDPDNIAMASVKLVSQRTQYKRRHKDRKRKGGSPPVDYTIVDLKVDLEIAVKNKDYEAMRREYHRLMRIING